MKVPGKEGRKTEAEVVGQHQERLAGERIFRKGSAIPRSTEGSHTKRRPHIKLENGREEEYVSCIVEFMRSTTKMRRLFVCALSIMIQLKACIL